MYVLGVALAAVAAIAVRVGRGIAEDLARGDRLEPEPVDRAPREDRAVPTLASTRIGQLHGAGPLEETTHVGHRGIPRVDVVIWHERHPEVASQPLLHPHRSSVSRVRVVIEDHQPAAIGHVPVELPDGTILQLARELLDDVIGEDDVVADHGRKTYASSSRMSPTPSSAAIPAPARRCCAAPTIFARKVEASKLHGRPIRHQAEPAEPKSGAHTRFEDPQRPPRLDGGQRLPERVREEGRRPLSVLERRVVDARRDEVPRRTRSAPPRTTRVVGPSRQSRSRRSRRRRAP